MFGGRTFQFRPVLSAVSLIAVMILAWLGAWQLQRLEWKTKLITQVEARTHEAPIAFDEAVRRAEAGEYMEYAPVTLTGRMRGESEARVFGSYEGAAGVYVFTPFETAQGGDIYVNRGFAPQGASYASADDAQTVVGLFRYPERPSPPASWFQPKGKSADGLWFLRDPDAFARNAGVAAPSYYVDAFAAPGQAIPKGGTTRLEFRNNHLDYALTWFGLAVALVGVWFAASLKSPEK
ncbi:MAG: SURF1 family cytochrome oxidase biogenesis protein [Parvularculaceae bacterium]